MPTWPSRGGIRCAICSRCTSSSVSSSAPTPGLDAAGRSLRNRRRRSSSPRNARPRAATRSRSTPRRAASSSAASASAGQVPCEQYHRVERGHGRFSRAFMLPEPIDVEASPPTSRTACSPSRSEGWRARRAARRRRPDSSSPMIAHDVRCRAFCSSQASSPAWCVTGRMRIATDTVLRPSEPGRGSTRTRSRLRPPPAARAQPRRRVVSSPAAGLHADRRAGRQGRRQHLVAAGRAASELAVRQRSVLQLFLRRSGHVRLARSPIAEPRLRRDRLVRRLHRHQQPRGRRRTSTRESRSRSATSARCTARSSAPIRPPTSRS